MEKVIKINCTSDHYLNLADLVPFEDNPRELSDSGYKKLKKSILSLGIFKPFLIWKKGNKILGGNQRHFLLEDLVNNHGFTVDGPLPVTYVDVDEPTARTIVLRDNQSDGEWSYEILAEYMNNLEKLGADLSLTGFSDKERADLEKLIQSPEELRESLEEIANDTDVEDVLKKNFGVSFKVPEEDWEFYQDVMAYAKKQTKSEEVWPNLKFLFEQQFEGKELPKAEKPKTILKKAEKTKEEVEPIISLDDEPENQDDLDLVDDVMIPDDGYNEELDI